MSMTMISRAGLSGAPRTAAVVVTVVLAAGLVACGGDAVDRGADGFTGTVKIDGSSTVFPVSEAVAEEFQLEHPGVRVTVGISGTGGGFKKFCREETDISDASRPIKPVEVESCAENGVEYIELPVTFDGISVVVNPENDWVDHLTVDELRQIWQPASTVETWSDIRPDWPDDEIHLYGPGTDSGTFDYFTEAIMGESGRSRSDFTASEDDNVLVQGILGDRNALGYFGFAYYSENADRIDVVPIDDGEGQPVAPSVETINDGSYQPLSRPLFIYVAGSAADRPEVEAFVHFYLDHAGELAQEVGYVALPDRIYDLARQRFDERITGSVFGGEGAKVGVTLEELLQTEGGAEGGGMEEGDDMEEAGEASETTGETGEEG